jgi:hypothetical protein
LMMDKKSCSFQRADDLTRLESRQDAIHIRP